MPIKWKCQVCEKEGCWSLVEKDHSPLMCLECWKLNKPEEDERREEE